MRSLIVAVFGLFLSVNAVADIASSPAFQSICTGGVVAYPDRPGYWQLNYPSFALSDQYLFASTELPPVPAQQFSIFKINLASPVTGQEVARFSEQIQALSFHNNLLWILFAQKLVAVDPNTGSVNLEVATTTSPIPSTDYQAYGFTWVGDTLVIAHGALGLVTFNLQSGSMSAANNLGLADKGLISKVTSVAAINDHAVLFSAESVTATIGTFEGLLELDLNSIDSPRRFPLDKNAGDIANATIQVSGDKVLINNWGIFQYTSLAQTEKSGLVTISWTPVQLSFGGQSVSGQLLGDLILNNGTITACATGSVQTNADSYPNHFGEVFSSSL